MRYSKHIIQISMLGALLAIAGCATSPFTGKAESSDQIQHEFDTYQDCAKNSIAQIKSDADAKTLGVKTATAELEDRKNTIVKLLDKLNGSPQPSTDATTPQPSTSTGTTAPIVASILGVLSVALHTDNRRKDGAIRTAKAVNLVEMKNRPHSAGGGVTVPKSTTVSTVTTRDEDVTPETPQRRRRPQNPRPPQ